MKKLTLGQESCPGTGTAVLLKFRYSSEPITTEAGLFQSSPQEKELRTTYQHVRTTITNTEESTHCALPILRDFTAA